MKTGTWIEAAPTPTASSLIGVGFPAGSSDQASNRAPAGGPSRPSWGGQKPIPPIRSETMATNGTRASRGPLPATRGSTSSQRRNGFPISPKRLGASLAGGRTVEPSPPSASGRPSAKTRHPPANAHSAGGSDAEGRGVTDGVG